MIVNVLLISLSSFKLGLKQLIGIIPDLLYSTRAGRYDLPLISQLSSGHIIIFDVHHNISATIKHNVVDIKASYGEQKYADNFRK